MNVKILTNRINVTCECGATGIVIDLPESLAWVCQEAQRHPVGSTMTMYIEVGLTVKTIDVKERPGPKVV